MRFQQVMNLIKPFSRKQRGVVFHHSRFIRTEPAARQIGDTWFGDDDEWPRASGLLR